VSVRFAYGFLDFLFTYNLHQLCPFAPLPLQELHYYYGLMPHGFAGHFLPARRGRHLTYIKNWCAVHGSFVPYALAFHIGFSPSL